MGILSKISKCLMWLCLIFVYSLFMIFFQVLEDSMLSLVFFVCVFMVRSEIFDFIDMYKFLLSLLMYGLGLRFIIKFGFVFLVFGMMFCCWNSMQYLNVIVFRLYSMGEFILLLGYELQLLKMLWLLNMLIIGICDVVILNNFCENQEQYCFRQKFLSLFCIVGVNGVLCL